MLNNIRLTLVRELALEKANWVIGGWENSVADGHLEVMPPREEMEAEIYDEVINADYVEIAGGLRPVKEDIRFVGTAKIKELISVVVRKVLSES